MACGESAALQSAKSGSRTDTLTTIHPTQVCVGFFYWKALPLRIKVRSYTLGNSNFNMKKTLKTLRYVDWTLGIGTVVAGVLLGNKLVLAAGLLGLLVAWFNPAQRLKHAIEKRIVRKGSGKVDHTELAAHDDALYEAPALSEAQSTEAPANEKPDYSANPSIGKVFLHSSPHNQVKLTSLSFSYEGKPRDWA